MCWQGKLLISSLYSTQQHELYSAEPLSEFVVQHIIHLKVSILYIISVCMNKLNITTASDCTLFIGQAMNSTSSSNDRENYGANYTRPRAIIQQQKCVKSGH